MDIISDELKKSLNELHKSFEPISEQFRKLGEQVHHFFNQFDFSKIYDNLLSPMKPWILKIEEIKKDPDSLMNYMSYVKSLSKYFWAMPYNINTAELKMIFEQVTSEKEFDNYMKKYFNKQKIESLFSDIKLKLNRKHVTIFKQIEQSFYNKQYSLINNAIISIIDDELSYYTVDKGETKRKDVFKPIIEDFENKNVAECNFLDLFYLEMLNNNLNILFDNVNFNNIIIDNNKAVRRHTTQHGKKYCNQRIVSIMLLNTLYNLLYIKEDLKKYHNKLKTNKQKNGIKRYVLIKNNKK